MDISDGYYYRDDKGVTKGPLDEAEFNRCQVKGHIKPGNKAWRQKAGAYFQIQLMRRYTIGRIFSISSMGYGFEMSIILLCLFMLVWIFRQPKLQEELHHGPKGENYFLGFLLFLTFGMMIFTVKQNLKRLTQSASEVVAREPPVWRRALAVPLPLRSLQESASTGVASIGSINIKCYIIEIWSGLAFHLHSGWY